MSWTCEVAVAEAAARAGGRAALRYFRDPALRVDHKADASPVTRADREAEAAIRTLIAEAFPADAWLGEESGADAGSGERRWIVDPIDGTRNFIQGIPLWATLVACECAGRIVASAVWIPALDECYEARLGGGARCNGEPITVSDRATLGDSLWCFEARGFFDAAGLGALFDECQRTSRLQRGLSDAYAHMLIASGRADCMIEPRLSLWDMAAPSLIVSEAGGRFSDLAGQPGPYGAGAVISNGLLQDDLLARIAKCQERP